MSKNIGKNISKNLGNKISETLLDHAKQFAADALKTVSERTIQKTAEAADDLMGNKITMKLQRSQKLHNRII